MKNHSDAFHKLIDNDYDLHGIWAYYKYKKEKNEYIVKLKEKNNLTQEAIDLWVSHMTSDTQISKYKSLACDIINSVVKSSYEKKVAPEYKKQLKDEFIEDVEIAKKITGKPKFWKGVAESLVAAFIFALLTVAFTIVFCSKDGGFIQYMLEYFK